MIPANELRIGNWVIFNDNTDREGQVAELHKYHAYLKCSYIPDHYEIKVTGCDVTYEQLNPIPLTPEILERYGFEKVGKTNEIYDININLNSILRIGINQLLNFALIKDDEYFFTLGSKVQYVHQLQNLFFSLENKELEKLELQET